MKILHVTASYVPAWRYGGPIRSVHGLCKGLARLGHDVHVFTTNVDGPGDLAVPLGKPVDLDGVHVWYFSSRHLRRLCWSRSMARELRRQVREFDIVHVHGLYLWPITRAAKESGRVGVPYVLSLRGMLVPELIHGKSRWVKKAWLGLLGRTLIEQAAALHVTSSVERGHLQRFRYRFPPIVVAYNGFDPEQLPASVGPAPPKVASLPRDVPVMLFLGRVSWEKGLERLLHALTDVPRAHLVIVGHDATNYRKNLARLASRLGLSRRIVFLPPIHGDEKYALFQAADLAVLPSFSENFGNVVLEAMAVGCPVAVTPGVGAGDVLRESGAGVVIAENPSEMGHQLAELLADHEKLREMGEQGRRAVRDRYSWTRISRRVEVCYRNILAHSGQIIGTPKT